MIERDVLNTEHALMLFTYSKVLPSCLTAISINISFLLSSVLVPAELSKKMVSVKTYFGWSYTNPKAHKHTHTHTHTHI